MKKKIILIICLILLLAIGLFILTGCGNKKEENKIIFKEMNGLSDIMKEAKRKNSRKDEVNVR